MNINSYNMDRFNDILNHKSYIKYTKKIDKLEKDRKFCKHNMEHFLSTARIMYILSLENDFGFSKEIIYTCGVIHDIGRWMQYEDGTPHEIAALEIASEILKDCRFNNEEIAEILEAVRNHREKDNEENSLSELLYKSDKLSRMCLKCKSKEKCSWKDSKKNLIINY